MKPRLLDLFCGAGGAAVGYHRAGFKVVGVDIQPQYHYPFQWYEGDAIEHLLDLSQDFDAVHASPPCQAYTKAQKLQGNDHADLVASTRELIEATGLPYVIENVGGAPLRNPICLEGQLFEGLRTIRPRYFETNWPLQQPMLPPRPRQVKMGRPPKADEWIQVVGHFSGVEEGRRAMGIDWMTQTELAEAIPPAYTEFVGTQLLEYLERREA